jgi:HrpA-like RNA helicase
MSNANLDQYSVVVLDEAHERSIYTSILLSKYLMLISMYLSIYL